MKMIHLTALSLILSCLVVISNCGQAEDLVDQIGDLKRDWPCTPRVQIKTIDNDNPGGTLTPDIYKIHQCSGYCKDGIARDEKGRGVRKGRSINGGIRCRPTSERAIHPIFKYHNRVSDTISYKKYTFNEHDSCSCYA